MDFKAEKLLEASQERIETARRLYEAGRYVPAIYLAGVSVECLLRAYRIRKNPQFDSKHDLSSLLKESGIADFIRPKDQQKFSASLGEIWSRWKNDYRYASHGRLTSEFKRLKLYRGIKGDILKANTATVVNDTLLIINIGVLRWSSCKN